MFSYAIVMQSQPMQDGLQPHTYESRPANFFQGLSLKMAARRCREKLQCVLTGGGKWLLQSILVVWHHGNKAVSNHSLGKYELA
jgi:hypothetical protein